MEHSAEVWTELDPKGDDPLDVALCEEVGKKLWEHYPGWAWQVQIPPQQAVVIIRNLDVDPRGKYGMVLRKDKLDPGLHCVMIAAGEFLERYGMRRCALNGEEIRHRHFVFERPEM